MTPKGSFVLDCLVGQETTNAFEGWAGFVLDLTGVAVNVRLKQLGRFKVPGNDAVHQLNVVAVTDDGNFEFLYPQTAEYSVDMKECESDLMGFCYTKEFDDAVELAVGKTYFVVSSEVAGGDRFVNMTDPATGTNRSHRDGLTYMSYLAPDRGQITGRVLLGKAMVPQITQEIDTSYGPLNFVVIECGVNQHGGKIINKNTMRLGWSERRCHPTNDPRTRAFLQIRPSSHC